MRMRRTLAVLGAALAVTAAAVLPVWLTAPPSPAPAPHATVMPSQLVGVQWDECVDDTPVPEEVAAFTVDRDYGDIGIYVRDPDGRTLTADQIEAISEVRSFVAQLHACLSRYPISYDTGPAQLDLAERAVYYDYLAASLIPCLDRHGVATSIPARSVVRYLDLTSWYLQALDLSGVSLDDALRIWDECPLLPSYLEGS
jgi:hypothetical protein